MKSDSEPSAGPGNELSQPVHFSRRTRLLVLTWWRFALGRIHDLDLVSSRQFTSVQEDHQFVPTHIAGGPVGRVGSIAIGSNQHVLRLPLQLRRSVSQFFK